MTKKLNIANERISLFLDLFFIVVFFSLPFGKLLFDVPSHDIQVYFILLLSIWGLSKLFISKFSIVKLSILDLGVFLLSFYFLIHFYVFSEATFYYYKLWVYIAYVFIFYLFRWSLNNKLGPSYFMHFVLAVIIVACVLQSVVGILQYFDFIESKNEYFKILGTFYTPNFLAAFLGFGFSILVWLLFVKKIKKKPLMLLGAICFILFGTLIIVSNSRGTWLAIIGSLALLAFTSKKVRYYLTQISLLKKGFAIMFIVISVIFCSKYLYELKPESVKGRTFVAKISLQEIAKHPIKGHGMFSFAGAYNKAKANYFMTEQRPWEEIKVGTYVFTPFNDYILVAFELGVLALFLIMALIGFLIIKTKINTETRLGLAILINICVLALFSSPLSNVLLMSVGLFGVAIILNYGGFSKIQTLPTPKAITYTLKTIVLVLCSTGILVLVFKLTNQKKFKNYALKKESVEDFIYVAKAIEDNIFSDLAIGKKLYDWGYKEKGVNYMEQAFQKSSAPKIGKVLATFYLKDGNYKRAEEIYRFNIAVEPYRYEARMDLLTLFIKSNRYKEAVNLSKEIIDFHIKVPSDNVDNYKKIAIKTLKFTNHYSTLKGSLSKIKIIKSTLLKESLSYKVYLPPINKITKKLPVIYVNDGNNYIKNGKLPELIDSLIYNDKIEPIVAVFLGPKSKAKQWKNIRQELFLCNPSFTDFFTQEFMPMLQKQYPISNKREDKTILGVSFGGLAATYLGIKSDSFKNIAMQSPAFHPCPNIYKTYKAKPKKDFKMFMSYGTGKDTEKQDVPMIKILKDKGYQLKVNRVENGNHEWSIWEEQLEDILVYFFQKNK